MASQSAILHQRGCLLLRKIHLKEGTRFAVMNEAESVDCSKPLLFLLPFTTLVCVPSQGLRLVNPVDIKSTPPCPRGGWRRVVLYCCTEQLKGRIPVGPTSMFMLSLS